MNLELLTTWPWSVRSVDRQLKETHWTKSVTCQTSSLREACIYRLQCVACCHDPVWTCSSSVSPAVSLGFEFLWKRIWKKAFFFLHRWQMSFYNEWSSWLCMCLPAITVSAASAFYQSSSSQWQLALPHCGICSSPRSMAQEWNC